MPGFDASPLRPAQHGWRVGQRELYHVGTLTDVEEPGETNGQGGGGIASRLDCQANLVGQAPLEILEHRAKEVALVVEMVVEGATRDSGDRYDLVYRNGSIASLRKQRPSGVDQSRTSRPRALFLATPRLRRG